MKISDLIAQFSARETGPIDIYEDIIPLIKHAGELEVYFWPAPIDTNLLKGRIIDEEYPYGEKFCRMVSIDYADSLSNEMARLVCCKELVHVLDLVDEKVTTEQAVSELIEKIVLPPEMRSLDDGNGVWNDRYGYLYALAILFPWATREIFRPAFEAGKITIDQIAEQIEIPVEFAAVVMDSDWHRFHHIITN